MGDEKLKKIALFSIAYILLFNILLPFVYYKLYGYFYIYGNAFEPIYMDRAAILMSVFFILSLIVVLLSKDGNKKHDKRSRDKKGYRISVAVNSLFFLATAFRIFQLLYGMLPFKIPLGELFLRYLAMFLDYRFIYFIKLYYAYQGKKIKTVVCITGLYIALSVLSLSRSGIIWAVFMNITIIIGLGVGANIPKKKVRQLAYIIIILLVASPVVYKFTTIIRYDIQEGEYGNDYFARQIVGRLSFLEIAGRELKGMELYNSGTEVFREKYAVANQIKLIANQLIIGSFFEDDVAPNQYWRCVFTGVPAEYCKKNYCSINFVMPIYYIFKYGYIIGTVLYLFTIWIYFRFSCTRKEHVFRIFFVGYYLNILLNFFDWVYTFNDILCFLLSYVTYRIFCNEFARAREYCTGIYVKYTLRTRIMADKI